ELEPATEEDVVREELAEPCVDRRDVRRVTGQRRPSEGPHSAAEERSDIGRNEARVCERVLYARLIGLTTEVVAIIENVAPCPDELEQPLDVQRDRGPRPPQVLLGIAGAERRSRIDVEPLRHVSGQRVVSGGLVGHEVEALATRGELGNDVGGVPEQPDGERPSFAGGSPNTLEGIVERVGGLVQVPGLEPALD